MNKTASWTWPDSDSDFKTIEVTSEDLAYIKSLLVGWDVSELGAPALIDKQANWLSELFEEEPEKENLLNCFFSQAKLSTEHTVYLNPLTTASLDQYLMDEIFGGIPDKELKKTLLSQKEIRLERDPFFEAILESCFLEARGFDAKRGFRLSDLQSIIDLDKKLSKTDIAKKRKHYKSQLFIYLQLFLQKAEIAPGFYHTHDNYNWEPGKESSIAEPKDKDEWFRDINSECFTTLSAYIDILKACQSADLVRHMTRKKTLDYEDMVRVFNLDEMFSYQSKSYFKVGIQLEEILLKAMEHFPEENNLEKVEVCFPFVLILIRILNAQGRFTEAEKILSQYKLNIFTEDHLSFFTKIPNRYQQIAYYESCLCKMVRSANVELWRIYDEEREQNPIKNLDFDMRQYVHYSYMGQIDSVYADLNEKQQRNDLDEVMVSLIGQINLIRELHYFKKFNNKK